MTEPPWGTPQSPDGPPGAPAPSPARPYADPGTADAGVAAGPGFHLVVEQSAGSGESMRWTVDLPPLFAGHTREEARQAALRCARKMSPRHPWSERSRTVLRLHDDAYLVIVEGATKTFHFRVSVAQVVP